LLSLSQGVQVTDAAQLRYVEARKETLRLQLTTLNIPRLRPSQPVP